MGRIYLSPPHMSGLEYDRLEKVFASNWIAPTGPDVEAFEQEIAAEVRVGEAAALSSGTAALHLALRLLEVGPGDLVLCSNLTFAASAFAIRYVGAEPVLVDCDRTTWNVSPDLLEEALGVLADAGSLPKAVIVVDLYGQSADWDRIQETCGKYDVPIVEDAAEALGATYKDRPVGGFGRFGVFSFNGNKIITTSGGGMLVSDNEDAIARARKLASQAREPAPHYEHTEIGFNYRMSNVLAAIGRAQLDLLDERVDARRQVFDWYYTLLADLPGLEFMPEADYGRCTRWLTCLTIDPGEFGATREDIRLALEARNIESRPVWKPMHLQPVFKGTRLFGGSISRDLFDRGLCLPSGSALSKQQIEQVAATVQECARK